MKFEIKNIVVDFEHLLLLKPLNKLSDYEYDKIKPSIESMGGHWRERVHGFVFIKNHLERDNFSKWKEETQYFPTPKSVAKRVIELADFNKYNGDISILEPSAGTGNLLDEIPNDLNCDLYIVEPEDKNVNILKEKDYNVEVCNFEEFYNKHKYEKEFITHVLMNPPFSLGRDIHHTRLAYELLKRGGTLVSIVSENSLYYNTEDSMKFRRWLNEVDAHIEHIKTGAFKESGTTIDTVIIKVVKI